MASVHKYLVAYVSIGDGLIDTLDWLTYAGLLQDLYLALGLDPKVQLSQSMLPSAPLLKSEVPVG